MPFDSLPTNTDTLAAKLLRDSLKLLGPNGENWIKGEMARGQGFCIMGALHGYYILNKDKIPFECRCKATEALYHAIPKSYNSMVGDWNDDPRRTFEEVRHIFEKAIDIANSK